jgi:hypothetical protein
MIVLRTSYYYVLTTYYLLLLRPSEMIDIAYCNLLIKYDYHMVNKSTMIMIMIVLLQ